MEETMKPQQIPQSDSIEELAQFWDTHDLTDFEDQLEEVGEPVFVGGKSATIAIRLRTDDIQLLRRITKSEGIKEATLLRRWVRERLRK